MRKAGRKASEEGREEREVIRPLKVPRPVRVRSDEKGRPLLVQEEGRPRRVASIREEWRIDDEWWRRPISRRYLALVLEDGSSLTLYRDLVTGKWHAQGK